MLTVTSKFIRPSTSVEFYADAAFNAYRNTNFVQAGKLTEVVDTISPDGLTRTVVNNWTTRADFIAFKQDTTVSAYLEARRRNLETNGITQAHEFEFVPSEGDAGPTV
jgi:hypothetical protein